MRVLWILAHPESRSLTAALAGDGLRALAAEGHRTRLSDLYAMGWDPVAGARDVRPAAAGHDGTPGPRLYLGKEQQRAHAAGTLHADVRAEQEKLRWAEAVVMHFPLWWFGPPAILKGWFDRVLGQGFAFGLRDGAGRVRRYGDGGLVGRRALVVTSVGGRESGFGPRGVHGAVEQLLWPVLHGTCWYTGMAPLPPYVVYGADRLTPDGYARAADGLRARLRALPTARPLPYRAEAGGDYGADLVLRAPLAPGRAGLDVHLRPGEG